MKYLPHEIANIFPMMTPDEFVSLKADIRERGLKNPVILYEGRILDGRNRFKACQEVGAEIKTVDYDGDNALADVISWNLKRRHLNESMRGMVAAKMANLPAHRPEDNPANLQSSTRAEAAKMLNISERTVNTAKKVEKNGIPELIEKVEQGAVSVSAAATVSALDPKEQKEIINEINLGDKPTESIKKHIEAKNEGHSTAMQFSTVAISQLSRIKIDDAKRIEAFNAVINYINSQIKQER